jgi:hypothetical protein
MDEKIKGTLDALNSIGDVTCYSTFPIFKVGEILSVHLRMGNHRTLISDDLQIIRSINPRSIMVYSDEDGKVYFNLVINLD